jgi:predicted ATPase
MPVLIQFTGAQSSGKTTLVDALIERAKVPYSIINEVPRDLLKGTTIKHLDVDATFIEQLIIQEEFLLERYRVLGENNPLILSCRSPVDALSYALQLKFKSPNTAISDYVISAAEKYLKYTLNRKDVKVLTFYVEPLNEVTDDGVRNKESNVIIDKTIKETLAKFRVPCIKLPKGSLVWRIGYIKDTVDKLDLFKF